MLNCPFVVAFAEEAAAADDADETAADDADKEAAKEEAKQCLSLIHI